MILLIAYNNNFKNSYNITLHEWKNLWIEIPSLNELEPIWYKSQHS
jgi:hypothetical protein